MTAGVGLVFDLLAKDNASPAFLRVAGAADKAAASTERATRGLASSLTKASKAGAALTKGLTLPLLGIGAVAVDQAAKYQKAMTLLQTAGGETARNMGVVSKGIENIAIKTGTSLSQLSDGMYVVEKAGIRGAAGLKVLKAAAEGAKAENVDLGTAVNALTSVMMSYHLSADKAVSVENMLIRGSGMAKTSMQEYAGSLSTVVPIASAAHISFAQVAGAIATLTQHGTSAQESTQELANTIRNLQAPNNVAVKAMQQLGLNVVDVEKNLGRRGLTGTIDLLTSAIQKKMGPSGLVAVSAFKKSQSATADLNIELSKMPKNLRDLSQRFESGKATYKEYYKGIKDLGGAAYLMGRQFLGTMGQAKGFNDLLRAGNPEAQTFAAYLKQVMGGATGLNTALMLGGENMKYFTAATKDVSKAALEAGSDVLGWNKTSDTLAVKMDRAKASLQVMAVEIGTALIPAVSKLADWGTKAVHWFDGLDGTQKKVLLWTAGILAGLGPLFSIGSKLVLVGRGIGSFVTGAGNALAKFGSDAEGMSGKATRAVTGVFAAMGGAAIGTAVGNLTRNSSMAVKAIGAIGSAASGAAIGFGVGGPVGALIGGATGLISDLVGAFRNSGRTADEAGRLAKAGLQMQNEAAQTLLGTLQSVNGAYSDQYKQQLISQLDKSGILSAVQKMGLNPQVAVRAALGSNSDIGSVIYGLAHLAQTGKITEKQFHNLTTAFAGISRGAAQAEGAFERQQQAAGKLTGATRPLDQTLKGLRSEFAATGLNVTQLAKDYAQNGEQQTAAGMKTTAIIRDHIQAINADVVSQLAHKKSISSVASAYERQIGTLDENLQKMHFSRDAVQRLITTYGKIPKSVVTELRKRGVLPADIQAIVDKYKAIPSVKTTNVKANDYASSNIAFIKQQLAELPSYKTITVSVSTPGNLQGTYNQQVPYAARQPKAAGGGVHDGYFTVGERGWELGYKRGNTVTIFDNKTSQKMTGWQHVPGFAKGTPSGSALQSVVSNISGYIAAAHNINAAASDLAGAAQSLESSARAQKMSAAYQRALAVTTARLTALAAQRDSVRNRLGIAPTGPTAYDQLATAQQAFTGARSSVSSAVGAFDIATAGQSVFNDQPGVTASSILGQLRAAAAKAQKFGGLLRTLIRKGLPKELVMQLAQAGPAAFDQAQALTAATPGELVGIKSSYGALTGAGSGAGSLVANSYYRNGVDAANALIRGLKSQESRLNAVISGVGDQIVSDFEQRLGIKQSPSLHVHVHGIEDPGTFARRVETELARKALARVG